MTAIGSDLCAGCAHPGASHLGRVGGCSMCSCVTYRPEAAGHRLPFGMHWTASTARAGWLDVSTVVGGPRRRAALVQLEAANCPGKPVTLALSAAEAGELAYQLLGAARIVAQHGD